MNYFIKKRLKMYKQTNIIDRTRETKRCPTYFDKNSSVYGVLVQILKVLQTLSEISDCLGHIGTTYYKK